MKYIIDNIKIIPLIITIAFEIELDDSHIILDILPILIILV